MIKSNIAYENQCRACFRGFVLTVPTGYPLAEIQVVSPDGATAITSLPCCWQPCQRRIQSESRGSECGEQRLSAHVLPSTKVARPIVDSVLAVFPRHEMRLGSQSSVSCYQPDGASGFQPAPSFDISGSLAASARVPVLLRGRHRQRPQSGASDNREFALGL